MPVRIQAVGFMIFSETSLGKISKIGLGTVQFGLDYGTTKAKTQDQVDAILDAALKAGINFLDTARDYGDSEKKIGSFLKRRKKAAFIIATKLARLDYAVFNDAVSLKKYYKRSIQESLEALGVDKIDVLQLHQIDRAILENPILWNVIHELKQEGSFEIFGISCYEKEEAGLVLNNLGGLLGAVQAPMNVLDKRMDGIAGSCRDKKAIFIARSLFLKGALTMPVRKLPKELKELEKYREALARFAAENGLSEAELAVLFVVSKESVTSAILGVDSAAEISQNAQTLDKLTDFKRLRSNLNIPSVRDNRLLDPRVWTSL